MKTIKFFSVVFFLLFASIIFGPKIELREPLDTTELGTTIKYHYTWLGKFRDRYTVYESSIGDVVENSRVQVTFCSNYTSVTQECSYQQSSEFSFSYQYGNKVGANIEAINIETSSGYEVGYTFTETKTAKLNIPSRTKIYIFRVNETVPFYYRSTIQPQQFYLKLGVGLGYHNDGASSTVTTKVNYNSTGFEFVEVSI